jgi:GTPase SAR1 family protein
MPKGIDLPELNNLWIWGPAGCGKSTTARRMCNNDFYPKQMNKWWDGYQNEEVVIIDDFEKESHLGHHLKIWADHFSFLAETKGGMLQIRPKRIIITSNYSPHDCFPEDELQKAILRRFKIQRMGDEPRRFPHFEPYSLFNGAKTPVIPFISELVLPDTPDRDMV